MADGDSRVDCDGLVFRRRAASGRGLALCWWWVAGPGLTFRHRRIRRRRVYIRWRDVSGVDWCSDAGACPVGGLASCRRGDSRWMATACHPENFDMSKCAVLYRYIV